MCMQQKDKQVVCMLSSCNPDENIIMKCYYYEVIISLVINAYNNMLGRMDWSYKKTHSYPVQ